MPTLQARAAHGGHSGSTPLGDRGSDVVDEPIRVVTGRGGEHDAGREPCVEQLAVSDPRGQHPTQSIHDGGIRDITEQTIGDGHAIGQPGQTRPPRERAVSSRASASYRIAARTVTIGETRGRRGIDAPCRNPDIRSTVMRRRRRMGEKPASVLSSIMPADRLVLTISVPSIHASHR